MFRVTGPHRVVGLAVLAVSIIVAATLVMLWQLRNREVRHFIGETQSVAALLATNVDQAVKGVDITLRDLRDKLQSTEGVAAKLGSHELQMELTERLISAPQIRTLFVVDQKGRVVNSSRGDVLTAVSVAEQSYYKAFEKDRAREAFFGGLAKGRTSQLWKIYLARRFTDASGAPAGLVVASMDATYFERLFGLMQLDIDRKLALYMEDGTLFASHPAADKWLGKVAPEMMAPGRIPGKSGQAKVFPYADEEAVAYTYAVVRTEHFPLLIGVGNDEADIQSEWRGYAGPIALGALLVSASIIAAGLVLYRRQKREERLAAALHEASRRASALVETMMDAIVTIDDQLRIVVFNPAAERLFGWSAAEMLGQPLDRLLPGEVHRGHDGHIAGFIASGVERRAMSPTNQMMGCRRDGSRFSVDATISRAMVDGRLQLTAAMRDVTERERAKANLQHANGQLRKLADALQDVREAERIRIARELHDDLGQRLTGLKLDLSWLSDKLKKDGSVLAQDVDATRANLDSAMAGARRIWTELQPVMVDDLGFGDAVEALARETSRHSHIEINTQLPARATMSKGPVATALFRVVQEALHNLVRHAGATRATVGLVMAGEELLLTVSDNGVGFDAEARMGKGLGLVSMRERVLGLEGSFHIDGAPGRGTEIRIKIPLAVLARDETLEHDEEPT